MAETYSEAFALVADLAAALEVRDINKLPGAWEHKVDGNWRIAVNGHEQEIRVAPSECMEVTIPPFAMAVWRNGWLAGLLTPFAGTMVAHPSGQGASEDALILALQAAIESVAA